MSQETPYGWTAEEWTSAWTIRVGDAYICDECGTIAMCSKGGVGTLEPVCCGRPMRQMTQDPPQDA